MCLKKKKKKAASKGSHFFKKSGTNEETPENHHQEQANIVVALWNYVPGSSEELHVKKGDKLQVVQETPMADGTDGETWTKVRNLNDGRIGYVPSDWIAKEGSARCNEWYYDCTVTKRDIAQLLMGKHLGRGAFVVRARNKSATDFMLTLRISEKRDVKMFKHYRIRLAKDESYYISRYEPFDSLQELVDYYRKSSGVLECELKECPHRPAPRRRELSKDIGTHFVIDRKELKYTVQLGKGNFGNVWLARWVREGCEGDGIEVAVKEMKGPSIQAEAFLSEAKVMKKIDHPNVVRLYGVCVDTEPVSKGMSHLEQRRLVHRDLAARNVLVGHREVGGGYPVVKIADFGLARLLDEGENEYRARTTIQLALKWMAPESYTRGSYNTATDVWSFGILMFEVLTHGQKPFEGMTGKEVHEKYASGWRMRRPDEISKDIFEIMRECWRRKPETRITFKELSKLLSARNTSDTTIRTEDITMKTDNNNLSASGS